jgi:hypothetical protein
MQKATPAGAAFFSRAPLNFQPAALILWNTRRCCAKVFLFCPACLPSFSHARACNKECVLSGPAERGRNFGGTRFGLAPSAAISIFS